jgi:hypothetical protein
MQQRALPLPVLLYLYLGDVAASAGAVALSRGVG